MNLLKQNLFRARDFLATTIYKVDAFKYIIATERTSPVEADDVNNDIYDLEGYDENEDENQDEKIVIR